MSEHDGEGPLLAIIGETASGKSALAMELAEKFGGEIICADSRTVYRGMDIGTAKPTPVERQKVPHHCLDLVDPDQSFTAADFKRHADAAIRDITARGKLPFLVGGTGLYVDAVLYDFHFRPPAEPAERARLSALSVAELEEEILAKGLQLPENARNPRHLVRVLETDGQAPERHGLREDSIVIGLRVDSDVLTGRIQKRVAAMLETGLEHEARTLTEKYGWDWPALQTIGYREWRACFEGRQTRTETKELIIKNTLQLARRQRTWFRRNNSVHWLANRDNLAESVDVITALLNN